MFTPDTILHAPGLKKLDKSGRELVLAFAEQMAKTRTPVIGAASRALPTFIQKAQPTLADVHVSTELKNLSIAYIQQMSAFAAGGTAIFGVNQVAGFFTEYSGMKFAMFFMGEYINMITMSALVTLLFLGGWHSYIGLDIPILVFAAKVFLLLCVFIWLRSTFPRIRYDRLMTFGWKVLLPVAMLNMFFYSVVKVLSAA